jgi:hypothetical protein
MRVLSYLLFLTAMVAAAAAQTVTSEPFQYSITTPSLAWPNPPLQIGATNATAGLTAGAENETSATLPPAGTTTNLFPIYYGTYYGALYASPQANEAAPAAEAQASSQPSYAGVETCVWEVATPEALREHGYGMSLAEAAAYWKAHPPHAIHVYGNTDIDNLPKK